MKDRGTFETWKAETRWGQLFDSYAKGGEDGQPRPRSGPGSNGAARAQVSAG